MILIYFQIRRRLLFHQGLFDADLHTGLVADPESAENREEGDGNDGRRGGQLNHLS